MIIKHILTHGLIYATISTVSLFVMMITLNPRIWGYTNYPDVIKSKVPEQTPKEKKLAAIIGIIWTIIIIVLPVVSTLILKNKLGGEISILTAFANMAVLAFAANLMDLIILDWLIVSKITPGFVIIEGTEAKDYKDFSNHYKAHLKSSAFLIALCLIAAVIIHFL